ncbi:hypothetical protein CB1_002843002 [Camelus ferus]|nr:hypothetical protein CB1_002843002 [Camelus ferus]
MQPVVVVVSMCLYRTGQSYLVNRLAGESKGFSLGSTVRPHTKGISLYSGFYGDNQKDSCIFALAALQSSTSVYNNMGPINQQGMDQLQEDTHPVRSSVPEDTPAAHGIHHGLGCCFTEKNSLQGADWLFVFLPVAPSA